MIDLFRTSNKRYISHSFVIITGQFFAQKWNIQNQDGTFYKSKIFHHDLGWHEQPMVCMSWITCAVEIYTKMEDIMKILLFAYISTSQAIHRMHTMGCSCHPKSWWNILFYKRFHHGFGMFHFWAKNCWGNYCFYFFLIINYLFIYFIFILFFFN